MDVLLICVTVVVAVAATVWLCKAPAKKAKPATPPPEPPAAGKAKRRRGGGGGGGRAAGAGGASISSLLKKTQAVRRKNTAAVPDHPAFLRAHRGHNGDVSSFDFSKDGKYVATADENGLVRVVKRSSLGHGGQAKVHSINIPRDYITAVAFSPDGRYLCGATALTKDLMIWQIHTKEAPELKMTFASQQETEVSKLAFSAFTLLPAAPFVTCMGSERDTVLSVFEPRGRPLGRVKTDQVENYDFTVSPDGEFMSVSTWQQEAKVWQLKNKSGRLDSITKVVSLRRHPKHVAGVAFSPSSRVAYTVSADGTWFVWDIDLRFQYEEEARILHTNSVGRPVSKMALNRAGTRLAFASENDILIVDIATAEVMAELPLGTSSAVKQLQFGPEDTTVAVLVNHSKIVQEWNVPN